AHGPARLRRADGDGHVDRPRAAAGTAALDAIGTADSAGPRAPRAPVPREEPGGSSAERARPAPDARRARGRAPVDPGRRGRVVADAPARIVDAADLHG